MSNEICRYFRFEAIEKAKIHMICDTNIETSPDEMKVLDNFLFRCWQLGWLQKYEEEAQKEWIEKNEKEVKQKCM